MTRLLSETWRGSIALVVGLLVALASTVVAESLGVLKGDGNDVDLIMLGMAGYLGTYVVLTVLAFARLPWAEVEAWARRTPPVHWARQAMTSSRPGPGTAAGVGLFALFLAVFWVPRLGQGGVFSTEQQAVVIIVVILASWLAVAVTYAVAYLLANIRSGYAVLGFPGKGGGSFTDHLYLALMISTTFGTTDVEILEPKTRRLVASHGVLAFVFNTVVLGAVVSVLVNR